MSTLYDMFIAASRKCVALQKERDEFVEREASLMQEIVEMDADATRADNIYSEAELTIKNLQKMVNDSSMMNRFLRNYIRYTLQPIVNGQQREMVHFTMLHQSMMNEEGLYIRHLQKKMNDDVSYIEFLEQRYDENSEFINSLQQQVNEDAKYISTLHDHQDRFLERYCMQQDDMRRLTKEAVDEAIARTIDKFVCESDELKKKSAMREIQLQSEIDAGRFALATLTATFHSTQKDAAALREQLERKNAECEDLRQRLEMLQQEVAAAAPTPSSDDESDNDESDNNKKTSDERDIADSIIL